MSNNLLVVPIAMPMATGIILLFLRNRLNWQRIVSGLSAVIGLIVSFYLAATIRAHGIQVLYVGDFPAPFSIVLAADLFGAMMVILSMLVGTAVLFYSFLTMDRERENTFYYPLYQFLLMGVNGSFLTGDIFNLFVWFEVLLIASYILLTLGGEPNQLREGFKYVIINVLASALFLVSVAVMYSSFGTVNMADLAEKAAAVDNQGLVTVIGILFLIVFGIKAAIFPLYFWLPRSYFTPPTAVAALFGGLLTKVGVYAIVRIFTLIFIHDVGYTHTILIWVAGLTMLFGVLGAIAQMDFKRILSYHIISQIGYMIMGLGIFTPLALAGSVYYIAHHIIVKSSLFLTGGVTERLTGTTHLQRMSGVLATHPGIAGLFLLAGLSLAGVPPFSGFFSKFVLIEAGLLEGRYGIVVVAIVVSLLTLFSMIKIFRHAFWGEPSLAGGEGREPRDRYRRLLLPVSGLLVFTVIMGFGAEYILGYAVQAAEQLMNPNLYIQAVLGGS